MKKIGFEIGVWVNHENSISINDCIEELKNRSIEKEWINLSSSYLIISTPERNFEIISAAFVEIIARQFRFVYDRLIKNEPAFLRVGILHTPNDRFLLFEPEGEYVMISEFYSENGDLPVRNSNDIIQPELLKHDLSDRFPFKEWDPEAPESDRLTEDTDFINYVLANKDLIKHSEYKDPFSDHMIKAELQNVKFPKKNLLLDLKSNAELGLAIYKLLNRKIEYDYY